MTQKTIEVVVAPDGSIRIEAMGFQGADCEKATAFLEIALGVTGRKTKKADYFIRNTQRQEQKVGQ
jgi:Protein of unknown function (DUF2997)